MKFNVGHFVTLSAIGKETYEDEDCNPWNSVGKVVSVDHADPGWDGFEYPYGVDWDNGCENDYREQDLEFHLQIPPRVPLKDFL